MDEKEIAAKKLKHDLKHAHEVEDLRTYDGEGFRRRAGCVCFKSEEETQVFHCSSYYSNYSGYFFKADTIGTQI